MDSGLPFSTTLPEAVGRYLEALGSWQSSGLPRELYGLLESLWGDMSGEERVLAQRVLRVQLQ